MKLFRGYFLADLVGIGVVVLIFGVGFFGAIVGIFNNGVATPVFGAGSTVTATSTVIVGNATPVVSAVTVNAGSAITLTANATTAINVVATITDNNGCGDITNGTTTVLLYRSGITSSTCMTTANNLNCYQATVFTASSTCAANTQNTTTTFGVYYFADSTQDAGSATSSFPSQNWLATVIFKDANNGTGTADSSGVDLNVLTAINVTTSSINYGTLSASSTTGSTNQLATSTNAGNSTTTIRLSANSTLTKGADFITTSSQRYSTSSFTFSGTSTALTASPVTVLGFTLVTPTSTTNVSKSTYWGLEVVAGIATGTYSGVNLFTSLYIDVAN